MTTSVVGIDLGTTFSLAAYVEDGKPTVVRDDKGIALIPSVISFYEDSVLVGSEARQRSISNPDDTIFSVKRLMGRTLEDLEKELPLIPYQIVEREIEVGRKVLHVKIGEHEHTPEELSAIILQEVRRRAGNPTKAVITVPAYFDDTQRQATRDAGRIAGLDVLRIVNEPTAAALAYGLDQKRDGIVAVYDLGGGTFDCSILSIKDGVFKVLSTNGDTYLGGDDFDRTLMNVAITEMGINTAERDSELTATLRQQAEQTKIALSENDTAEFVVDLPEKNLSWKKTFTRAEFEKLIEPLVKRSLDRCRSALRDAELKPDQVEDVVLVGGSTRVPLVRQKVEEYFGRKPHSDLNPDEVVALGAAVQADILSGGRRHLLLLDVVPLSLGIETLGGAVSKLIYRNSTIPARATERFTTQVDNQTGVDINIYQGERDLVKDCRNLGKFKLSGIPPMGAQMPQIDVTFLVDANGMLTVTAKEQRSGQEAKVTVQPSHGMTEVEVERLVLESVEHARDDYAARRLIELRNKAEGEARHTEKLLAEGGDQLAPEEREKIEIAVSEVRKAIEGEDSDALQQMMDQLALVMGPLAELVMNAVVKKTLEDRDPDSLNPDDI